MRCCRAAFHRVPLANAGASSPICPIMFATRLADRLDRGRAHGPPWFDRLVLMFQREVAERIVATPAERADYGRLAVLCGWRTSARILFDVAPSAFVPPPKVVSSVVELVPRAAPLECAARSLARVTAAAFGQRRKMLRQSLKGIATRDGPIDVGNVLSKAGLDGHRAGGNLVDRRIRPPWPGSSTRCPRWGDRPVTRPRAYRRIPRRPARCAAV